MTERISRRNLLAGLSGVAANLLATVTNTTAHAEATDSAFSGRSHPVPPVNEKVAARHGLQYRAMPQAAVGVDVESLITVRTTADVAARRARLVDHVWKGAGLPARRPNVRRGVALPGLAHRGRTDALVVPLRYGLSSTVFHLHPRGAGNGRLAIYHNGHGEPPDTMLRTVDALLGHGYAVLVCAMPFKHWNAQPITGPGGPVTVTSHDDLARWESRGFSPLTFFLEPVAVALNHAIAVQRPASVDMIGLSGGGWTTTVYAAIDPRVTRSYPVAGSLPFYLRESSMTPASSRGDWEQRRDTLPGFYGIAGYLDLYVMAATAPARRQLQVLNRFDPCCFSGVGHRSYGPAAAHRAAVIGGRWDVLEDATHDEHTVSPYALEAILDDALTAVPRAAAGRPAATGGSRR